MITPPELKQGDCVGIVSPARKVTQGDLQKGIDILESWGLGVIAGSNALNSFHQFSGTDKERTTDFQDMLDDDSIRAVFCARGGYGSVRIIDKLDFSRFIKSPKWIVGYSDITVFHSHIHSNLNIESLHAEMPYGFGMDKSPQSLETLNSVLFGKSLEYDLPGHELNHRGFCSGQIIGGNLSILHNLTGTVSDINTDGKILFIEDVDEYLYHIDRMMMSLRRSGKLEKLAGLIVGGMSEMNDNEIKFGRNAYEIITNNTSDYSYPKFFGFPGGHLYDNRVLIIGRHAALTVGDDVNLKFDE